ncbi:hypothetical protein ACSMXN_22085 [Jatrophihabitans sp. DSM 45814]
MTKPDQRRSYEPEIDAALNAFKALRDQWALLRRTGSYTSGQRDELSRLQTVAQRSAAMADPFIVESRDRLDSDSSTYEDRHLALSRIDHATALWVTEREVVGGFVEPRELDGYLHEAKKTLGNKRRAKLPLPPPFSDDAPIVSLANQLSVPRQIPKRRDVGRAADVRILAINAILVVLSNCFIDAPDVTFDMSYSVSVGIAI